MPYKAPEGKLGEAVERAHVLIAKYDPWPDSFPTLEEAEEYVAKVCQWKNFDYDIRPGQSPRATRMHKRHCHYHVAFQASMVREFDLEIPLVPTPTLHAAVDADVIRVHELIKTWPASFSHINAAKIYVNDWCWFCRFEYTRLLGLAHWRMRMMVNYKAALKAFEAGAFMLEDGGLTHLDRSSSKPVAQGSTGAATSVGEPLVQLLQLDSPTPVRSHATVSALIKDEAFNELAAAMKGGLFTLEAMLIDVEAPPPATTAISIDKSVLSTTATANLIDVDDVDDLSNSDIDSNGSELSFFIDL
ncbi:hypothetical protein EJ04DRAFT_529670 [Polyplosphaeria fusca]|uniref:Uncharacterized protein n=1 Tax=Polyplosphaeria fusca TaxID=682080 RepID=A0A9P4QK30_9PLEO|nr:hypothetical protein EJ04DRAFT_529670 [Polyplosphaeria fusca]